MSLCLNCQSQAHPVIQINNPNKGKQLPQGEACDRCGYTTDGLPSIKEVRMWVQKQMQKETNNKEPINWKLRQLQAKEVPNEELEELSKERRDKLIKDIQKLMEKK